jgi:signal transduction histidine kinase/ActR/RegA family two-component response regulator
MYATLLCLRQHDPRLLAVAVLICALASAASLEAFGRAARGGGVYRRLWLLVMAVLLGSGVWATHFLAMLAYQRSLEISFGAPLTLLSLVVAIGGLWLGADTGLRHPKAVGRAVGGAICGGAFSLMHFIGVAAIRLPATIVWDAGLVTASIVIAVVGAAAALATLGDASRKRRLTSGAMLVLAICGLHFTAMGAVTLHPAPAIEVAGFYDRHVLAWLVGSLAGLLLAGSLAMLLLDGASRLGALQTLQKSLNFVPTAIGVFDRHRRLIFWNQAYADVLQAYGVKPRGGEALEDLLKLAENAGVSAALLARLFESLRTRADTEIRQFQGPDGRWVQGVMTATSDGGCVIVLSDVSSHMAVNRREAEARRLAEEASRAKSEFLANVSHEIRTPLNAVLGMVQVMARDPLEPRQRDRLEVIRDSGHALLETLNAVLDLTKIEAGRVELEEAPFDLEAMLERTAAAYAPLAAQKDVQFVLDVEPEVRGAWRGDEARLRQVLTNLLSNALKFTTAGEIRLIAGPTAEGLRFEVRDTGIGIPADKLSAVFEKFTQADSSTSRRFGGTGLGLAICREFVSLMQGRWDVDSIEGQGSRFTFTVPLARAAAVSRPAGAEEPEAVLDQPLRILAADDNPTNQLILAALLESLEVQLTLASNGREALDHARAQAFDLILMDVQMPDMDGLQASHAIRRLEIDLGRPRTPILALTANVMSHQVEEYLAAGMDGVVAKPVEAGVLFSQIAAVVQGSKDEAAAAA